MKKITFLIALICFAKIVLGQDYKQLQEEILHMNKEDQQYRMQIDSMEKQFGAQSQQLNNLWKSIHNLDSIHQAAVTGIIDKHGWLGPTQIGDEASFNLSWMFLHFDQKTKEKYLPLMKIAVKEGKAESTTLALLVDKIALLQGKKQIYGSQVRQDEKTGEYYLAPLEDPENVDKRRKEVGLKPLAEDYNLKVHNIIWDPKTYKPGV